MTIAIIAILGSLVFATIASGKRKANDVACISNLRNFGVALNSFAADQGVYPLYHNPDFFRGINTSHMQTWDAALAINGLGIPQAQAFTFQSQKIFQCPNAGPPASWPADLGYSHYGYNVYGLGVPGESYGLNEVTLELQYKPVAISQVLSPSQMYAIGDGFKGWQNAIEDGSSVLRRHVSAADKYASSARAGKRHSGAANVAAVAGNVSAISLHDLFQSESAEHLFNWNRR